ncbi:MAG: hypothetical protein QNJ97_05390 [Myxococcota bacterium]|nr:hypothetical protein [Myxococcota bacterium]
MVRNITLRRGALIARISLVLTGMCIATGCELEGGLNQNQHTSGNEEDGVSLSIGDIAIDPWGTYFISNNEDQIIYGDIEKGIVSILPDVEEAHRLAFGSPGKIYFTSSMDYGQLIAYDVNKKVVEWKKNIFLVDLIFENWQMSYPLIEVTGKNQQLVLTDPSRLRVLSIENGAILHDLNFERNIIDVDLHPDGDRIIVTLDHAWHGDVPNTDIVVYSMALKTKTTIAVPNCSDELVLAAQGDMALLAPTRCIQENGDENDPVSVIDLATLAFVRNLPGFGPTAVTVDQETAVAFMDLDNLDESLFDSPEDIPTDSSCRYHLMFIDVKKLKFDTLKIGDNLPRYTITPSGQILLVDADAWFEDARIRLLDIPTRTLYMVAGPDVRLNDYVITSDSRRALLLDDGLYDLSVLEKIVSSIPLPFTPTNLNITPDDTTLLLREEENLLWTYDIATQKILLPITLGSESS